MRFFKSVALSFLMFSRIPMPRVEWNEENMCCVLCAFPLVGAVISLCLWGWSWLCGILGIGPLLFAAGITLIPVAVTGGIHLDGFCDTVDALSSHAAPERKREILKDPHAGAFAVIAVLAYLLLYFALCTELRMSAKATLLLGLIYVVTRALCGLSVICLSSSGTGGLLDTFKASSSKKPVMVILLIILALCAAGMLTVSWIEGGAMLFAAVCCSIYLYFMSNRQFGGMSGDLAGFFLQLTELSMVFALVFMQKVVVL